MGQTQVRFTNPNKDWFKRNIMYASASGRQMTEAGRHEGATAVIVGSGPSLNDEHVIQALNGLWLRMESGENIVFYACKAAIKWLNDHGMPPQYGVSIDPGAHIACDEKISKVSGVTHIMATVTAPEVFEYLEGERVELFHSVCGLLEETDLYTTLFGSHEIVFGGFNVINRALGVAQQHGCSSFIFAGADSGWRQEQPYYCDGVKEMKQKKLFMNDHGRVDGTPWESTPDMVASATALARVAKEFDARGESEKVAFLGDTLPGALRYKDEEFLVEVASQ